MECASIIVEGKVQGVWFRDYVRRSANGLNLNGWVKNEPNGTVKAEIEGDREAIEKLIVLIKIGSPMSRVDNVTIDWVDTIKNYNSFKIVR